VSAGLATFSLGEETDGSIISPANRAALYAIKPTVSKLVPGSAVPISHNMDSVGVMAKGAWDVAAVQGIMDGREAEYMAAIAQGQKGWKGIKIGLANRGFYFNTTTVEKDIVDRCLEKIEKIKSLGAEIVEVEMPGVAMVDGWTDQWVITRAYPSPSVLIHRLTKYLPRCRLQGRCRSVPPHPPKHHYPQSWRFNHLQQRPRRHRDAPRPLLSRHLPRLERQRRF
jgi:Asp-tRNA(Asn)/Glu-tRNA(Gln) amidotransferase A subunit family amidase